MFGKYLVQGYVVSSTLDSDSDARTPSDILSDYFARSVHLVMKGPAARACPPTTAFPALQETAKFQDGYPFLVASEESLGEVGRVVSAFATDESPAARIGGIDRERWRDGGVEIERSVPMPAEPDVLCSDVLYTRFRPNIVCTCSGVPFAEDMWRQIRIHPASASDDHTPEEARTFTLVSKCTRCLVSTHTPCVALDLTCALRSFPTWIRRRARATQRCRTRCCSSSARTRTRRRRASRVSGATPSWVGRASCALATAWRCLSGRAALECRVGAVP